MKTLREETLIAIDSLAFFREAVDELPSSRHASILGVEMSQFAKPALIVLVTFTMAMANSAFAQNTEKSKTTGVQGRSYAELAKLPDISGMWSRIAPASQPPPSLASGAGRPPGGAPGAGGPPGQGGPPAQFSEASARSCSPHGMPNVMNSPFPMQVLLTPGQVTILLEFEHMIRTIYTDGRSHPEDPDLRYLGDSIGHWEGQTLVVDTTALKSSTASGTGSDMHIIERMHLSAPDVLTIETSVYNAASNTPRTATQNYQRKRDWTLREYFCEENPRDIMNDQGKPAIDFNLNSK